MLKIVSKTEEQEPVTRITREYDLLLRQDKIITVHAVYYQDEDRHIIDGIELHTKAKLTRTQRELVESAIRYDLRQEIVLRCTFTWEENK